VAWHTAHRPRSRALVSPCARTSGATHRGPLFVCTVNVFAQRSCPYAAHADPAQPSASEQAAQTDSKQRASAHVPARACLGACLSPSLSGSGGRTLAFSLRSFRALRSAVVRPRSSTWRGSGASYRARPALAAERWPGAGRSAKRRRTGKSSPGAGNAAGAAARRHDQRRRRAPGRTLCASASRDDARNHRAPCWPLMCENGMAAARRARHACYRRRVSCCCRRRITAWRPPPAHPRPAAAQQLPIAFELSKHASSPACL